MSNVLSMKNAVSLKLGTNCQKYKYNEPTRCCGKMWKNTRSRLLLETVNKIQPFAKLSISLQPAWEIKKYKFHHHKGQLVSGRLLRRREQKATRSFSKHAHVRRESKARTTNGVQRDRWPHSWREPGAPEPRRNHSTFKPRESRHTE